MIAVFLPPYPFRGQQAPYLWIFYRLLSSIKEPIFFITGEEYLKGAEEWRRINRWEIDERTQQNLKYELPSSECLSRHHYYFLNAELFHYLLAEVHANPIAAFKRFLTEKIISLEQELKRSISAFKLGPIEAVLTCCNCPSLSAAAESFGIPVMHLELGPLRAPLYRASGYLDFKGVNGNTEAMERYLKSSESFKTDMKVEEFRDFFFCGDPQNEQRPRFDLGVPLQVEDDSNLIAFGRGFDNQALIAYARLQGPEVSVVVRAHPGSLFTVQPNLYAIDSSPNSIEFIRQSRKIITINSSIGLEAILDGRPVKFLGDSSFHFINEVDNEVERVNRLMFYLFAYLVPFDLLFNIKYLRFRIAKASEQQIVDYHMRYYINRSEELNAGQCNMETNGVDINTRIRRDLTAELVRKNSERQIADRDQQINNLNQTITGLNQTIAGLNQTIVQLNGQFAELRQAMTEEEGRSAALKKSLIETEAAISNLLSSHSWRLTKPLRLTRRLLRGEQSIMMSPYRIINPAAIKKTAIQARNAMRYLIRGDFGGLVRRIKSLTQDSASANIQAACTDPLRLKTWGIITTQHTLFIAHLIAERLNAHGWNVDVLTGGVKEFPHDWYIVICPQMFNKLPAEEKRIVFQMEQSVSSRWFTDTYLETLNNSLAVLEYSLFNIDFLASKGIAYPHVHYLPVGAAANYSDLVSEPSEKIYDVLFYGDSNSSARRRNMLDALKQHFNVRIVSEIFGQEMSTLIKQARLVVNLHYYENALLEAPRIQECLSLGVPVVSESAQDQGDYPELVGAVRFFKEGSIPAMLEAVQSALEEPISAEIVAESVMCSAKRFTFMFDRFLVAMGFLSSSHVKNLSLPLPPGAERIALSLPETIGRRRVFESERPNECFIFDGIRLRPGWVGCGLSYLALAQHALKQGVSRLTVMEDDVVLPPDFEAKLAVIHEFLSTRSDTWDLFSGVIAHLHPDAKILAVEEFKGMRFVIIDKMTSTVFNVYGESALKLLSSWNPENVDAQSNTIDRYLESQSNLRVVVALPFLVGHREEMHSTLWGFQNTQYLDMIANSERTLIEMVEAHRGSLGSVLRAS